MPTNLGKYTLKRKIAVGGMAEIWLAERPGTGSAVEVVVIKRILPHLARDKKFVEMFRDEARLAAMLEHPHIVRIWDFVESIGEPFIAMEYVDGPDLDYLIDRALQLGVLIPQPIAARVVIDALEGLHYAHNFTNPSGQRLGLVHRDVSPHNILVGSSGAAKVCDFGVAKAITSRHKTQTGAVKGKFAYMSPEQIADKKLDGRADLFAMGIVLYELTTNQRPFGDVAELLAVTAILTQNPTDPREYVADFPEALEAIILKALVKNRDERFPSALAMKRALEAWLESLDLEVTQADVAAFIADLLSERPSFLGGELAPPLPPRFEEDGRGSQVALIEPPTAPFRKTPIEPIDVPLTPQDFKGDPPLPLDTAPPHPERPPSRGTWKVVVGALVVLLISAGLFVGAGAAYLHFVEGGVGQFFEADPEIAEEAQKKPRKKPRKRSKERAKKERKTPAATHGVLVVNSRPKAEVFFEDKRLGRTPDNFKLPLGKQKIRLINESVGLSESLEVEIKAPPEITNVFEVFGTGDLELKFITDNPYTVSVDGFTIQSDVRKPIELVEGEHTIVIKNPTGQELKRDVTIKKDKPVQIAVNI